MKKIKTENGLKVRIDLKEDKKSLISGRNKLQISLNGNAIIDVVPTVQLEEMLILILENENENSRWEKHQLKDDEGLELSLISEPEKLDEFGICYDTEVNEIRIFGEDGKVAILQTPADWVIKFKTQCSWMNNQVWLNPAFI